MQGACSRVYLYMYSIAWRRVDLTVRFESELRVYLCNSIAIVWLCYTSVGNRSVSRICFSLGQLHSSGFTL